MATVKETLIDTISAMPDDASYDEIMRELAFQAMVTRGMEDIQQGRVISHEEMKRRLLWVQEAEARLDAYDRGEMKAIPLAEVLAKYGASGLQS